MKSGMTQMGMPKDGKAAEKPGHGAKAAEKGSCDLSMTKSDKGVAGSGKGK